MRSTYPEVAAARGLRVTHLASGFSGVVIRIERDGVVLQGVTGLERVFRLIAGSFNVAGKAVALVAPRIQTRSPTTSITASGSISVATGPATVARASRILVEGIHDAELVERVWGDDLRIEGVVVERLDGVDGLAAFVREFSPGPGRRLGVLVDHLVPGSKEARLAREIDHRHVLVAGTPFIDVWEAVRPEAIGIPAWPGVPRGIDWKVGVCQRLGVADPIVMWRRIIASVNSYADLDPLLVGAVESLIDFVTAPEDEI
ncbi:MAG: DUF3097 domain-containing protein [Actinomycetota bacterium]|nr:DUF3097 domain-containing protein [Actinomycetota bacterium]